MEWTNVAWFLTGLGAVVVLLTRIRLGGEGEVGRTSGFAAYSRALVRFHTFFGVLGLGIWIGAMITDRRLLALAALVPLWLLTVVGLLLLARWLPSGGRHADDKATDAWGEGAGLSLLGHVGMLIGVGFITFLVLTHRI